MKSNIIPLLISVWVASSCAKETQLLQLAPSKSDMMFAANMRLDADGEPTVGTRIRMAKGERYHDGMGTAYYTVRLQHPSAVEWSAVHAWFTGFLQKEGFSPFEKSPYAPSLQAIGLSILTDYLLPAPPSNEKNEALLFYWDMLQAQNAIETEVLAATIGALRGAVQPVKYEKMKSETAKLIAKDIEASERELARLRANGEKASGRQADEAITYMHQVAQHYSILKKSRRASALLAGL